MFMTPPFQVADEPSHFLRAVEITQGGVFAHPRGSTEIGSNIPQSIVSMTHLFDAMAFHPDVKVTPDELYKAFQIKWNSPSVFVNQWNTAVYPPSSYLGSIVAIFVGRHLNITPLATFYLARIGNLVVDGGIGIIALLLAGEAGGFILLVLALPMSISLMASCSQDGMIISLSAFFAACLLHFSKNPQEIWNKWLVLALAVALGCMAAGKAPYLALLPLVWLFGSKKNIKPVAFITLISMGIFLFWSFFGVHTAIQHSAYRAGVLPADQVRFLMHHKLLAIKMFTLGTVLWMPPFQEIVGVLGWLDTVFPYIFYKISYLIAALVFINSFFIQKQKILSKTFALKLFLFFVFVFVSYDLIFLALYMTWTPVGLNVIEGVQGRYLLPIIIMFALLPKLTSEYINRKPLSASYFALRLETLMLIAFVVYSTCTLFDTLSSRFW